MRTKFAGLVSTFVFLAACATAKPVQVDNQMQVAALDRDSVVRTCVKFLEKEGHGLTYDNANLVINAGKMVEIDRRAKRYSFDLKVSQIENGSVTLSVFSKPSPDLVDLVHAAVDKLFANIAVELSKDYASAGTPFIEQKNYDEALKYYDAAVTLDANNSAALNNRGVVHHRRAEKEAAIADFKRAAELGNSDAKRNLKECYNIDFP